MEGSILTDNNLQHFKRGYVESAIEYFRDTIADILIGLLCNLYSPIDIFTEEQLNEWAEENYDNTYFNEYEKSRDEVLNLKSELEDRIDEISDSRAILKFFQKHPEFVDNDISRAIYNIYRENV